MPAALEKMTLAKQEAIDGLCEAEAINHKLFGTRSGKKSTELPSGFDYVWLMFLYLKASLKKHMQVALAIINLTNGQRN